MKSVKKIINFLRLHSSIFALLVVSVILLIYFSPVWRIGEVPFNGNLLVSFFYPWKFEKFEGYPTGIPFKQGGGFDTSRIGYPYFSLVRDAWRAGVVPLWNPYNFGGLPLAAETQSAAFYPLHIFGLFLSQINVWTIFSIAGFLFCFLFSYWYFLYLTKHTTASLFGAFTFAFNTFFIVWNQEVVTAIHSAMWLPLLMLSIDHLFEKIERKWFLILLTSSILSILAGYTQVSLYTFMAAGIYFAFRFFTTHLKIREKILRSLVIFSAFGLSIPLTLFQLMPLNEMYMLSSRTVVNMKDFLTGSLLPLYSSVQFLMPEFFGNSGTWNHFGYPSGTFYEHSFTVSTVAIFFALFSLLIKDQRKEKLFFFLVGFIALVLSLDTPISRWIFTVNIPALSSSIANRILFIPPFAIAALSAYGVKHIFTRKEQTLIFPLFISMTILSVVFAVIIVSVILGKTSGVMLPNSSLGWTTIVLRNSIIPGFVLATTFVLVLIGAMVKRSRIIVFGIIFLLGVFQIGYFFQKVIAFSPGNFIYPHHPVFSYLKKEAGLDRVWGFEEARIENNFASQLGFYSSDGYDSLAGRRFAQLLKSAETDGKWTDNLSRSDVGIQQANLDSFLKNPIRLKLLNLNSIKYILYKPAKKETKDDQIKKIDSPDFKLLTEINGTQIYENIHAIPRVSLISHPKVIQNNQDIFNTLFSDSFDPAKEIIIENSPRKAVEDTTARAMIQTYSSNKVVVQTESKTPQYLLLTDAYYPGWNASIDGNSSSILRANFALRAVFVPEGKHIVEFHYFPNSFRYGLYISFATLCTVIILLIFAPFVIKKYRKI